MSIKCKFQLSRSSNIYYSGEEITGSLMIFCLKQQQLECITLEFYGQSTVKWWELDKTKEIILHNDISTHEVANKTLNSCEQKHVCVQLNLSSCNRKLQPHVEYTFKFCFLIDQNAPATFRCRYGETEYGLRLQIQRIKKSNKEFHQRIVIKNKLDLTQGILYKKPCAVFEQNDFGQINLKIPCTGFTPGQYIPYYLRYQSTQIMCKVFVQFICCTTCHIHNDRNNVKQIKQIINYRKHLSSETFSYLNIPLFSHISNINDQDLMIKTQYYLKAFLIGGNKKVLLHVSIPITIGSTPCFLFNQDQDNYMCYDNFGSSSNDLPACKTDVKLVEFSHLTTDQIMDSACELLIPRKPNLTKSLRYFYKKSIKFA